MVSKNIHVFSIYRDRMKLRKQQRADEEAERIRYVVQSTLSTMATLSTATSFPGSLSSASLFNLFKGNKDREPGNEVVGTEDSGRS